MRLRVFSAFSMCMVSASAQIVTDRPDFTESAVAVPLRWTQIETGFTIQWEPGLRSYGFPETLIRYGFARNIEFRLALPNYENVRTGGVTERGFGDTYLGFKVQLGPLPNSDDLAIIPGATIPTGQSGFSSDGVEPELKVCWSRDLGHDWSIAAMAFVSWPTVDGSRTSAYQQTVSFAKSLTERTGLFIEYAGGFADGERPDHVAHGGFVFFPSPDSMFDVHFGLSLTGPDSRPFVGAGHSWRF